MRYTYSRLLFFVPLLLFAASCTDDTNVDPVTSANGMTFITTRILVQQDLITAKDIIEANAESELFECSASKILEQMAKEYIKQ